MRIITYNLCHLGRTGQWQGLHAAGSPDLLLLQEASDPETFCAPSHGGTWHWRRTSSTRFGSAIWARRGTVEPVEAPGFEGWIAAARVRGAHPALSGGELFVASLHAPPMAGGYVKTVGRMLDALAPLREGLPFVLGGDFNMTIGRRLAGESRQTTAAECAILDRLASEFGVVGCWADANPDQPLPQTLRWVGNREIPYHCDGIFAPAEWGERVRECTVLGPNHPAVYGASGKPMSDHNPVLAAFDL